MNKKTIPAADFQRKTYAKPRIKVVEIDQADIICTSTTTFSVSGNNFEDEEDW